jgi:hypothetical protein
MSSSPFRYKEASRAWGPDSVATDPALPGFCLSEEEEAKSYSHTMGMPSSHAEQPCRRLALQQSSKFSQHHGGEKKKHRWRALQLFSGVNSRAGKDSIVLPEHQMRNLSHTTSLQHTHSPFRGSRSSSVSSRRTPQLQQIFVSPQRKDILYPEQTYEGQGQSGQRVAPHSTPSSLPSRGQHQHHDDIEAVQVGHAQRRYSAYGQGSSSMSQVHGTEAFIDMRTGTEELPSIHFTDPSGAYIKRPSSIKDAISEVR